MGDVPDRIVIGGKDVLVFLAGGDRFCNVSQLGGVSQPEMTFERYLVSGQGQDFVRTLAEVSGVPAGRLYYYKTGEGYWANHELTLDFAGWKSPALKVLYYRAVREWAATKLGQNDDDDSRLRDNPRVQSAAILLQTVKRAELAILRSEEAARSAARAESKVDTLNGRVDGIERKMSDADRRKEHSRRQLAYLYWADMEPRSKVNAVIRHYGFVNEMDYRELYARAYSKLRYVAHVDVVQCARNRGVPTIEYVANSGLMPTLAKVVVGLYCEAPPSGQEHRPRGMKLVATGFPE